MYNFRIKSGMCKMIIIGPYFHFRYPRYRLINEWITSDQSQLHVITISTRDYNELHMFTMITKWLQRATRYHNELHVILMSYTWLLWVPVITMCYMWVQRVTRDLNELHVITMSSYAWSQCVQSECPLLSFLNICVLNNRNTSGFIKLLIGAKTCRKTNTLPTSI